MGGWPLQQTTSANGTALALAAMTPIVSWSPASQGQAFAVLTARDKSSSSTLVSFRTQDRTGHSVWYSRKQWREDPKLPGHYVNMLSGAHVEMEVQVSDIFINLLSGWSSSHRWAWHIRWGPHTFQMDVEPFKMHPGCGCRTGEE